jgi:hypothetical protein
MQSITSMRLAALFGMGTAASANTKYSNYAHLIADELQYTPTMNSKSKPCWLLALAYRRSDPVETADANREWIMRPELVGTLQDMKWA